MKPLIPSALAVHLLPFVFVFLLVPVLLLLPASLLQAQGEGAQAKQPPLPIYVGVALGATEYDDDGSFRGLNVDDDSFGAKLYGGYRFSPHFSVEASAVSLGEYESDSSQADIDTAFGALTLSAVASVPTATGIALYGQLGVGFVTVSQELHFIAPGNVLIEDDDVDASAAYVVGFGLSYTSLRLKQVHFRLGWERYYHSADVISVVGNLPLTDDGDQEIDLLHLGAAYQF